MPTTCSIPGYVTAAAYEADGQTKSITYANGVATTFTYLLQRDWLTRVTTKIRMDKGVADRMQ